MLGCEYPLLMEKSVGLSAQTWKVTRLHRQTNPAKTKLGHHPKVSFFGSPVVTRTARSPLGDCSMVNRAVTRLLPLGQFSITAFMRGLL
jgi:hypothetical protein